ncbi:apolipoprotein D-like [Danaus plexippus]|uniref:apolipoprotein D-like n=1 Tax=Danaus plexippus TaxID=13037 RepID=UPI002AB15EF5|nr:apolipoprotein D-like [Danaus plexippus]
MLSLVLLLAATASAQIPSLGWCPDYQPMADFNVNRFLGTWYESERYFTVSELGSRCVAIKYNSTPEGRILVSNEITNSLTGLKRVLEGSMQMIGREGEGRMMIKYTALPRTYDNEFSILDTDYDNYAVMWSCSGIGPVHIQNAWVLTRERIPPLMVLQSAYSALERFRISRTFFVKTDQADCNVLPDIAADPSLLKSTIEVSIDAKNVHPIPNVEIPIEKKEESKIPPPIVRSAIPEISDEPMKMQEIEMMEKKEEKIEKPVEMKNENMEMEKEKEKEKMADIEKPQ